MNEIYTFNKRTWIQLIAAYLLVFAYTVAQAQQASQGNATVFSGGQITLFGSHSFIAGGTGTQIGIVKTDRSGANGIGIVNFGKDATHTGANNANHIDGYVGKYGTAAFNFPIGNGVKLRPAGISGINPNNPATAVFKAAYWFSNSASYPTANMGAGVSKVSNLEYWDVDGASTVDLTLTWDAASSLNALTDGNLNNLAIVGYNTVTSKWETLGGTSTGTLTGTGTIVTTGIIPDKYAAFTFGSVGAEPTTPDLRPYLVILNVDFTIPTTSRPFTVRVRNMRVGTIATQTVTVRIYKPSPSSIITLTGAAVTNWTVANSPLYYTLTSNLDVPEGTAGIAITGNISLPTSVPSGTHPLRVLIPDLSGGELLSDNGNNEIIGKLTRN